jgi:hypothetical protein
MKELNATQCNQMIDNYLASWRPVLQLEHGTSDKIKLTDRVREEFSFRNMNAHRTQVAALKGDMVVGSISGLRVKEDWLKKIALQDHSYAFVTSNGTFARDDPEGDVVTCVAIQVDPSMRGERLGSKIIEGMKGGLSGRINHSSAARVSGVEFSHDLLTAFEELCHNGPRIMKVCPYTRLNGFREYAQTRIEKGMFPSVDNYISLLRVVADKAMNPSDELLKIAKKDSTYFHFKNGAKQIQACPRGRPADFSSLGFNNLVYYKV